MYTLRELSAIPEHRLVPFLVHQEPDTISSIVVGNAIHCPSRVKKHQIVKIAKMVAAIRR